jgi:hypothetical protein
MKPAFLPHALLVAALTVVASAASAATTDPIGDFIPSYTGVHNADLDVVSAFVTYNPATDMFLFSGTMNGAIGTTASSLYVWGVDRGAGTARFGPIATGVLFDSVVTATGSGNGAVTLLLPTPPVATNLAAGSVTFAGNTITVSVSGALLVPNGVPPTAFTWNLWPRDTTQAGTAAISDFAPDNANVAVAVVPEPSTVALLALGLGALVLRSGRRRAG